VKKPLLLGAALAVALVALAVTLPSLRARLAAPATAAETALPAAEPPAPALIPSAPAAAPSASAIAVAPGKAVSLKSLGRERLDAQVRRVVDSMDRLGRPPAGIVQGGRRGGRRGAFENLERRLPVKPPGYYRESDVWPPRGKGRGAERLVFGREGEVYYSPDHYRTFVRLR
jgi:guanyl-specific ribonuclease Sa